MDQFLCFRDTYFSLGANFCQLSSSYVSPQYYLLFYNLFKTVFFTVNDVLLDDIYNNLLMTCSKQYLALAMMPSLMIFATISLALIMILISIMKSLPQLPSCLSFAYP